MRLPSLKVLAVTLLAAGALGLAAERVIASTPTVKGKGKVFQVVNFATELTAGQFNSNIQVVPDNQTMVLTDVVVTNNSGGDGTFALRCLGESGSEILLGPVNVVDGGSFAFSFSTGIECEENTTMQLTIAAATALDWNIAVSGYLRKGA